MSARGSEGSRFVTSVFVTLARVTGAASLLPAALLNVGEAEKPADAAAKLPPPGEAAGTCGCNKSCTCTKAAVVFSDLYSTGTRAADERTASDPADLRAFTHDGIQQRGSGKEN